MCIIGHVAAQNAVLHGKIIDEKNNPISFAVINLTNFQRSTYTDNLGNFQFSISQKDLTGDLEFKITNVGKKTIDTIVSSKNAQQFLTFKLFDLSLTLKEVEINQTRKILNSNSSIVFDRQALDQIQAFSLADVLNNLPGKKIIATDLHSTQNITLRSEAGGIQALSNSLGVAIIIDDIQQSNNANMQNRNVGKWGISSSSLSSSKYGRFDVPFSGIDIREIPTDNIESIEVITGVAPAKYGDLTDGAVIVNRQAGKTPFQFSTRINGASTNLSLAKGIALDKKWGAINVGINYLNSNENPSDKTKIYNRVSTNLMWTSYLFNGIKNTLSIDYNTRLDDVRLDPDDGFEIKTFSKSRNINISNRTSINLNNKIAKSLNISFGYSSGIQESYNQRYLNKAPEGISDKDVSGEIYEGYFIPGTFLSFEHIKGRPLNLNGNIGLTNELHTGKVLHQVSIGSNIYFSRNSGEGVIADPTKPRWANTAYQNDRPYNFESLPNVFNYGIYLQDNVKIKVFGKVLSLNPGLRYDVQNASANLQPRINTAYNLTSSIQLTAAYGISTKGPTLAHRYPAPIYTDIILLNKYTGNVTESIFLVYTDKFVPDNSKLKSSQSNQFELGFKLDKKFFSTSFFGYFKENFNGFSNNVLYKAYVLPEFDYTYVAGARPIVTSNGKYMRRYVGNNVVGNDLSSKNYGIEWGISTKKIEAVQTSINVNTSFNYSSYLNNAERVLPTSQANIDQGKIAWFGIYPPNSYHDWNFMTKVSTATHIPRLGFVINLITDFSWQKVSETSYESNLPIAYLDQYMSRYEISSFDPKDPNYGHLSLSSFVDSRTFLPFVYANMSLRIAKEIKKKIRISISAVNFLNVKYRYYNPNNSSVSTYSSPTSVGAELSIKL